MDKKILFIGDSWVTNFFLNHTDFILGDPHNSTSPIYRFWVEKGFVPYFMGDSSRDTQTIIDIWTKYIPYLSEEDLLDRAWGLSTTSRLACQAKIGSADLTIEIPRYTINHAKESH